MKVLEERNAELEKSEEEAQAKVAAKQAPNLEKKLEEKEQQLKNNIYNHETYEKQIEELKQKYEETELLMKSMGKKMDKEAENATLNDELMTYKKMMAAVTSITSGKPNFST